MKRASRLILLFVLSTISTGQAGGLTSQQLIETLLSPNASDEEWHTALDAFQKLPADTAIRTLFPVVAQGVPGGIGYATYNCSDPDHDRRLEGWGRYCVASWLWCKELMCDGGRSQLGRTLLELWTNPLSLHGQGVLLTAIDFNAWVPEAEEPVRTLFMDSAVDSNLREQAAACLLHHFGTKYQRDVGQFALSSSHEISDLLFRELVSPPLARVSGVDFAVVRLGFWRMADEMAKAEDLFAHGRSGGSYYGAFLVADKLGTYLGETFTPDYKSPRYQGELGKELWFRETTEHAFTWWLKNRERFQTNPR